MSATTEPSPGWELGATRVPLLAEVALRADDPAVALEQMTSSLRARGPDAAWNSSRLARAHLLGLIDVQGGRRELLLALGLVTAAWCQAEGHGPRSEQDAG